ncbi:MAG: response regulator [Bacteroidota bacterium]
MKKIKKMLTDRVIPEEIKDKINILVVEDNLLGRKMIGFLLKKWGFHFDACANGKLALENLKLNKYDLILMDIQMPEMDGHETSNYIRNELKLGLPIIAMTSNANEEERKRCLTSGMVDYIAKPIVEEELYNLTVNYLFTTVVENPENHY